MKRSKYSATMIPFYLWIGITPHRALGSVLVALSHQETVTPIHSELGTILQLPSPVKTVTPSRYFKIREVSNGQDGSRTDVRTFHITLAPGAQPEPVTFVLAGGKALSLKLVPTPGADKFLDIKLDDLLRKARENKFLFPEMLMMRAMILDEPGGFSREIASEPVASPFDTLGFTLTRIYAAEGLTGYVFKVQNRSRNTLDINLSSIGLGTPSRAVLAHGDTSHLDPCPMMGKSSECETTLRLVVRSPKDATPLRMQQSVANPPFVKAESNSKASGGAP